MFLIQSYPFQILTFQILGCSVVRETARIGPPTQVGHPFIWLTAAEIENRLLLATILYMHAFTRMAQKVQSPREVGVPVVGRFGHKIYPLGTIAEDLTVNRFD